MAPTMSWESSLRIQIIQCFANLKLWRRPRINVRSKKKKTFCSSFWTGKVKLRNGVVAVDTGDGQIIDYRFTSALATLTRWWNPFCAKKDKYISVMRKKKIWWNPKTFLCQEKQIHLHWIFSTTKNQMSKSCFIIVPHTLSVFRQTRHTPLWALPPRASHLPNSLLRIFPALSQTLPPPLPRDSRQSAAHCPSLCAHENAPLSSCLSATNAVTKQQNKTNKQNNKTTTCTNKARNKINMCASTRSCESQIWAKFQHQQTIQTRKKTDHKKKKRKKEKVALANKTISALGARPIRALSPQNTCNNTFDPVDRVPIQYLEQRRQRVHVRTAWLEKRFQKFFFKLLFTTRGVWELLHVLQRQSKNEEKKKKKKKSKKEATRQTCVATSYQSSIMPFVVLHLLTPCS